MQASLLCRVRRRHAPGEGEQIMLKRAILTTVMSLLVSLAPAALLSQPAFAASCMVAVKGQDLLARSSAG